MTRMCCSVIVSMALAACTEPPVESPVVTVLMTAGDDVPAYGTVPFPTDAIREGDRLVVTGLDGIVSRHADLVAAHVGALDGFGLRPLVEFWVDGALDPSTLPARTTARDDAAALIDVDPASPQRGRVVAMDWHHDADRRVIAGSPASGEVLREGTRYAAFVTSELRDARGAPLRRAAALDRLSGARWRSTAEALVELGALDERITGLAVFTTQHATAPLVAAHAAMLGEAAPTLAFADPTLVFAGTAALDRMLGLATRATAGARAGLERWGNDNPTGVAHDHVGVIGTGRMTVTRYRRDDTGTDGPEDETFALDAAGVPQLVAIDSIPITFIVPAAPPPTTGYPVVLYGHGLGAGRDQLLSFAEPLTAAGFVVVGIDMFGHGSRYDELDDGNNLAGRAGFTGENVRDGFGDITGAVTQLGVFEQFRNVAAVRDAFRQSALDLSRVVQLLRGPALDLSPLAGPAGTPTLDTRYLAYLGESFGTVIGTLFAAIEPDVGLYVLDVPGGGILDRIMVDSAEIGALALPLVQTLYGTRARLDRWNPLVGMMQAVIDGADPLSYAPHVFTDRFSGPADRRVNVVCIEVVGDQVLANTGTVALAQGFGLDVLTPYLEVPDGLQAIASPAAANRDGQTAVLVQYSPATHGANWSSEQGVLRFLPDFPALGREPFPRLAEPITITNPIYETLEQVIEILTSYQTGAAPLVRSTHTPIRDFDGDGTVDTSDPAPTDPSR